MIRRYVATIVPLVFLLCGAWGVSTLYHTIEAAENERLGLETAITAEQVRLRLEAWIDSRTALVAHLGAGEFVDQADIDQRFTRQARALLHMSPGFQALNFIDPNWVIRIVVPEISNAAALNKDLHNHKNPGVTTALAKAAAGSTLARTPIIDLLQGGKGIATYYQLRDRQGRQLGFVNGVFRVQELVDSCLYEPGLRHSFSFRLTNGDGSVAYQHETAAAPAVGEQSVAKSVRIVDQDWILYLCPTPDHAAETQTRADEIMAISGVAILLVLALVLRLLLVRQNELKESQAKYRLLVENQTDLVVKLDPDGNFLYASPTYCEAFGHSESDLLGTSFLPHVHPDDRESSLAALAELNHPPHRSHNEQRSMTTAGIAWHSWANSAVLDEHGNLVGITAVGRDITRRRELEDQLNLSRKMQAVGQLAGGIAHDFNNLLQSMLGNLQFVIQDTQPTGQTASDLQGIEHSIGKAMALTKQLLAFGRKQDLQPRQEDLNAIVTDTLEQVQRRLGSSATLDFQPAAEKLLVCVERGQAELVIHNLCDNAAEALDKDGRITIRTEARRIDEAFVQNHPELHPGDYAALTVSDNGHGMPPEVLARAFEPFFTTREIGAGTGLGLATTLGIVQQHKGTVLAESAEGQGSVFTILLPQDEAGNESENSPGTPTAAIHHATILLAEDNPSVRDLAVRVLERADYTVLVAEDGQQAIDIFAEHQETVDLVILDMVMPRLGGRAACDGIRDIRPEIPVLFASGYDPATMTEDGELPANAETLMKPYGIPELLQKVRTILDRRDSARKPVA